LSEVLAYNQLKAKPLLAQLGGKPTSNSGESAPRTGCGRCTRGLYRKPSEISAQKVAESLVSRIGGQVYRGEHLQYGAELAMNGKRVGLYLRVSTGDQTIETQRIGLVAACEARG